MLPPARCARAAALILAPIAAAAALAGCGSGVDADDAHATGASVSPGCQQTVMDTLGSVLQRVYTEGVESERTHSAEQMIEHSRPLREAIEARDPRAARSAARALLATGHLTNLEVEAAGRKLVSEGGAALAPLHGTIASTTGRPIATYTTSVWADSGFAAEGSGIAEGLVAIRAHDRSIGGTVELAPGALPAQGTLARNGSAFAYTSLAGRAYPAGSVQIYLLKPIAAVERLCGASDADTQVATLTRVAHLIYEAESGPRTLVQVRRVQRNAALLAAVANRDPAATRVAIAALLNQHIVRLRVSAGGSLLSDVGGPFVLAPVRAELRRKGRPIGSFVLSIQDDEGYLRLARRLAGLDTLMYMGGTGPSPKQRLVKSSLGVSGGSAPALATVPASGSYTYKGQSFRVFTVHAEAFPSGPLTIRVLIPQPYG